MASLLIIACWLPRMGGRPPSVRGPTVWACSSLQKAGVRCIVLSAETNPVVTARSRKLGLECVQGRWNKAEALELILAEKGIPRAHVAYVGNDVNDLACLARVGVSICVADAHPAVKEASRLRTTRPGGGGAVREICEWILKVRGVALDDSFESAAGNEHQPS